MSADTTLFEALKASCKGEWDRYVTHDFVRQLGAGTLPEACFKHYLKQDYLFLVHFARAYALAAYKSRRLADMRYAKNVLAALLDEEMTLHVQYCARWGISEQEMENETEAAGNLAYTRYVLETGSAGDLLDLHVALAPCVVGYAEVASWLESQPSTRIEGNPYRDWIEMYAGDAYQSLAGEAIDQLDDLGRRFGATSRMPALERIFGDATRLEIGFWEMGLEPERGTR